MKASSYGIGSIFKEALSQGFRNFIVPVEEAQQMMVVLDYSNH